jgi:biopolymer transport protein ExbB/TolQ
MAEIDTRRQSRGWDPSLILAAVGTVAFYAVVHQPSMRGTLLHHYTTEHVVEYVVVALFIWGIIDVGLKLLAIPREMAALRLQWLPPRGAREAASNAAVLIEQLQSRPQWQLRSRLGKRLLLALGYVHERGTAEGHQEYLQYLADQDDEATHTNYTLLRFAVGVTPILGLVGTVVHFGTALGGISFEKMDESLPLVVSEMGTAFNTTTIALGTAITMMFSMYLCERIERSIVRSINRYVDCELLNRFEVKHAEVAPFLSSIRSAHEEALQMLTATLQQLIGTWSGTIETLFQKFDQRQAQDSQSWEVALQRLAEHHQSYDAERSKQVQQSLTTLDAKQAAHLEQIRGLLGRVESLGKDWREFVDVLQGIARGEGQLVELQAILNQNLAAVHQSQQFEEALHVLTAAIHLLTSRQQGMGSRDALAA